MKIEIEITIIEEADMPGDQVAALHNVRQMLANRLKSKGVENDG